MPQLKKHIFLVFFLSILGILGFIESARTQPKTGNLRIFEQIQQSPQLTEELAVLLRIALDRAWGTASPWPPNPSSIFQHPTAFFVTLKKNGETRACMGSLHPQKENFFLTLEHQLQLALFRDPWHRPVQRQELSGMEIYLTATGKPQSILRLQQINPARDGILIQSGNKSAIVLPGEAKTLSYLLNFAKKKAGIKAGEIYQVYFLPSISLEVPWEKKSFSSTPVPFYFSATTKKILSMGRKILKSQNSDQNKSNAKQT